MPFPTPAIRRRIGVAILPAYRVRNASAPILASAIRTARSASVMALPSSTGKAGNEAWRADGSAGSTRPHAVH